MTDEFYFEWFVSSRQGLFESVSLPMLPLFNP